MEKYKLWNKLTGWILFAIASIVYILCTEPTASFWDCGEYIATSYKLQVGHPPGAPLFQLIGRFFSFFAFGDVSNVALCINIMSALASGLTIAFLFWTITLLAQKIMGKFAEISPLKTALIFTSGIVGALAYTFSDSFWFSAVEGEVYGMSSFFTAITFWAILKWESVADEKYASRWIILIAYLIGLSIGVHLLNLLALPAVVLVYYFKKYKPTIKGILIAILSSTILLGLILWVIIPYLVILAGWFERFCTNAIGLPFNSGTFIYLLILVGLLIFGLHYAQKHSKKILQLSLLCFTFLFIGYTSFFILIIRSNSQTPINENKPKDAMALSSYLGREQYGETPLVYGPYFNTNVEKFETGEPIYAKAYILDDKDIFYVKAELDKYIAENHISSPKITQKYVVADESKGSKYVYDKAGMGFFPRMWSSENVAGYREWSGADGQSKPTTLQNLSFFVNYQLGYMYFRYFMWNFAGKQNDMQGHGNVLHGNWISGIPFIDACRLGSQDNLPESIQNKGTNKFYFLPLLLGLLGFFYQLNKDPKNTLVVFLLFFFTGIAIAIYLNMYAYQPRERDYAFAASFYAFAIWMGLGVLQIFTWMNKILKDKQAWLCTLLITLFVPSLMAYQGWDDHNRSGRYVAKYLAKSYLEACDPNAVLFTNADNDTFPLWYAQEVEGIRPDVRVINLSLLNAGWYIDQMKQKAYDSEPLALSMPLKSYIAGNRNVLLVDNQTHVPIPLKKLIPFLIDDNQQINLQDGRSFNYLPSNVLMLPVDKQKVMENKTVPVDQYSRMVDTITWQITGGQYITKSTLAQLDLLAHFDWNRPVYFSVLAGQSAYIGLNEYLQQEGFIYRLKPIQDTIAEDREPLKINTEKMYHNLMHKNEWKGLNNPKIYLDETSLRFCWNLRSQYAALAKALLAEHKKDSALVVLQKALEILPDNCVPFEKSAIDIAEAYILADKIDKANQIYDIVLRRSTQDLAYYFKQKGDKFAGIEYEVQIALGKIQRIYFQSEAYQNTAMYQKSESILNEYIPMYDTKTQFK